MGFFTKQSEFRNEAMLLKALAEIIIKKKAQEKSC